MRFKTTSFKQTLKMSETQTQRTKSHGNFLNLALILNLMRERRKTNKHSGISTIFGSFWVLCKIINETRQKSKNDR